MPFGRRNKINYIKLIKNSIIILFNFNRTKKYILLNLKRMRALLSEIALGLACRLSISFTPFLGFHALLAMTLLPDVKGSMAATIIGTLLEIHGYFLYLVCQLWNRKIIFIK